MMGEFSVTYPRNMAQTVKRATDMHPRPWSIVDMRTGEDCTTYAWVADANGKAVIASSEWLNMSIEAMTLVVLLVNNLAERE